MTEPAGDGDDLLSKQPTTAIAQTMTIQQDPDEVFVYTYDFHPNVPFTTVTRLQDNGVEAILGREVDGERVIEDPSDYNGYIVLYQEGEDAAGEYALVFVDGAQLQSGRSYQLEPDLTFFNVEVNLLEVGIDGGEGGDGGGTTTTEGGTAMTEEGTTTTEAGTTTTEGETTTAEGGTVTTGEGATTEAGTTTTE